MTSIERVMAAAKFEKTDRIPVIPEVAGVAARIHGRSVKDYVQDGEVLAECQLAAQALLGYDTVIALADLCVEAEAIGCETVFPDDNYPHIIKPVMNSIEELGNLSIPDPKEAGRMPEIIKAVEIMKDRCHGKVPVVAHSLGPITIASRIMDIEKMLYLIVDAPDDFRKLLAFTKAVSIRFIECLIDAGADSIIMFDPSASPAVLPERIFMEFEFRNIQDIFRFIKGRNSEIITWYSVAGATQGVIKDLELASIDILTVDYLVPQGVAFDISSSLCFNGNIKPFSFVNGSAEELYKTSYTLLKNSLERGGFIIGSGCEVPSDAKPENIGTMVKASIDVARDFTVYGHEENANKCITFFPSQKKIYVEKNTILIDAATSADISIPHLCYKSGGCGECLVRVENHDLEYSKKEKIILEAEQIKRGYRLACQLNITSDISVFVPPESRITNDCRIYKKDFFNCSIEKLIKDYPLSKDIEVICIPQGLENKSTPEECLPENVFELCNENMEKFAKRVKTGKEFYVTQERTRNKVLSVSSSNECFGAAVDVGTTTIAVYLYDMQTAEIIESASLLNPQRYLGDNIITRSEQYMKDEKIRDKLRYNIISGINRIMLILTQNLGISVEHIYKVSIVGNSIMHHMFLNLELDQLVKSKFKPVFSADYSYENKESDYGLSVNKNSMISCLPLLCGLIGSDITAGVLACGLHKSDKMTLFIDIGTNAEIILGNENKILATSVAAGPAFEQSHVSGGRLAGAGAIHSVNISKDYEVEYKTIGGGRPSGFCGTAIIDVIASMIRVGLIDERGHFVENKNCANLFENDYILVPKQETAFFKPIVISNKDVQEVQKAKGAIMAGIKIIMKEYGITVNEIDRFVLTGAFGMRINIENAIRMGMFPDIPNEKVDFMPNAAGIGAALYMLSEKARDETVTFLEKITHINVANSPDFNNIFIDSMFLL